MGAKGFIRILVITIVLLTMGIVAYFFFMRTPRTNNPRVNTSVPTLISTITPTPASSNITLDELKKLMPAIVWEEVYPDTRIFLNYDFPEVISTKISGTSSYSAFSDQEGASVFTYASDLDKFFLEKGWKQATSADGPTGSLWSYVKDVDGYKYYIEFMVNKSCEGEVKEDFPCRVGSLLFYSNSFKSP